MSTEIPLPLPEKITIAAVAIIWLAVIWRALRNLVKDLATHGGHDHARHAPKEGGTGMVVGKGGYGAAHWNGELGSPSVRENGRSKTARCESCGQKNGVHFYPKADVDLCRPCAQQNVDARGQHLIPKKPKKKRGTR